MSAETAQNRFEFRQTEMAIPIRIVIYSTENATAAKAAEAAFVRFHELNRILSDYDPQSELRRLCDTAGGHHPVHVSDDLWRVLVAAQHISELSDGAFDVSVGPLVHLWRNARRTKERPSPEALEKAKSRVGYQNIRLDPKKHTVVLLKPNMRLDLGGIAKGYAVDQAMDMLRKHGLTRALIDAGGNVGLGDPPPGKKGWRIGVSPPDVNRPPREYLYLSNCALSTSGDLWQYAVIDGKRYSHIIDPHTGVPLTDHSSVTVIGRDGLSTDGVSSAVAILGPEKGLKLIESMPDVAAFIVQVIDGKERLYESKRWKEDFGNINDPASNAR
jgi:thiamine biosynthesis lipoprotein